ncbi:hypothetical protein V8E36_001069 [Tilletia maclaganii]
MKDGLVSYIDQDEDEDEKKPHVKLEDPATDEAASSSAMTRPARAKAEPSSPLLGPVKALRTPAATSASPFAIRQRASALGISSTAAGSSRIDSPAAQASTASVQARSVGDERTPRTASAAAAPLRADSGRMGTGSPFSSQDKGKQRERDIAGLTEAERDAAYREACRPPARRDGNTEWDLPLLPKEGADPELQKRLDNFHVLKLAGTHFNSSLMQSQSFHNPHIYAKLVAFVDIEETGSNYNTMTRPGAWNPHHPDVLRDGDARILAEVQKRIAEEKQAAQAPGKRTSIAFASSSSSKASKHASHQDRNRDGRQDRVRDRDRDRDANGPREAKRAARR